MKISTVHGELVIKTGGLDVMSMLTSKSDLREAIANSVAHKWLLEYSASRGKNKIVNSSQLPSTETQSFVLKAFYSNVKNALENLVQIEGLTIGEAIAMANSLAKGNKIVANSDVIMYQIKDALRYGKQAGVI